MYKFWFIIKPYCDEWIWTNHLKYSDSTLQPPVLFVNLISTWRQAVLLKVLSPYNRLCETNQGWSLGAEERADGVSFSI